MECCSCFNVRVSTAGGNKIEGLILVKSTSLFHDGTENTIKIRSYNDRRSKSQ